MKNMTHTRILKKIVFALTMIVAFVATAQSHNNATSLHFFKGKWITTPDFENKPKLDVFHREPNKKRRDELLKLSKDLQNQHILFRKNFELSSLPSSAKLFFTADDYAKIYINGNFVAQGPAAGYPHYYFYHEIDISKFLKKGKNTIAVHTYYQGLINRVWVSGDYRHGFLADIVADNKTILQTDTTWKFAKHTAFSDAKHQIGYHTQFSERYNASSKEVGFQNQEFDHSQWQNARLIANPDYSLAPSPLPVLQIEHIKPVIVKRTAKNKIFIDFGGMYVGYFSMSAKGKKGDEIQMRFAQELNNDGSVRYKLRANCDYREYFVLSGNLDTLNQFDSKSFRYVELVLPENSDIKIDEKSFTLIARHMPFELKAKNKYANNPKAKQVWDLCVRSLQYGTQEQIQDCMEREKGYYLGDGTYTILTYALLTKNYAPMLKLIDDFLRTSFIDGGLVTCANCSFMQEIAEYPMYMYLLLPVLAEREQDREFIRARLPQFKAILDHYKKTYGQKNGLLANLDKWCVVEWPKNWRDGYDYKNEDMHNVMNAWYIGAIKAYNKTARMLGEDQYEGEKQLIQAFYNTFYDSQKKLFKDGATSSHISFPGNVYPYFMGLYPNEECKKNILEMIKRDRLSKVMLFASFPTLAALQRDGENELMLSLLTDDKTWMNMIKDGATATFEGWHKSAKWNTSLFHLALTYAAAFMVDDYNVGKALDLR